MYFSTLASIRTRADSSLSALNSASLVAQLYCQASGTLATAVLIFLSFLHAFIALATAFAGENLHSCVGTSATGQSTIPAQDDS